MQTAALTMEVTRNGIHFLAYTEHNGELRKSWRGRVQNWNMASIPRETSRFRIPTAQYGRFIAILKTKEGKLALNELKNEKTNEIINQFLTTESKRYESITQPAGDKYIEENWKCHISESTLLKEMIAEPLVGNNQISHQRLNISHEDIFNKFVKVGLL